MILLDGAKIAVRALLFVRRELLPDKWVFLQLDVYSLNNIYFFDHASTSLEAKVMKDIAAWLQ